MSGFTDSYTKCPKCGVVYELKELEILRVDQKKNVMKLILKCPFCLNKWKEEVGR